MTMPKAKAGSMTMSGRAMNAPGDQADNVPPEQNASSHHRPSSIETVPHSEHLLVATTTMIARRIDGFVRIECDFRVNAERGGAQWVDIDG